MKLPFRSPRGHKKSSLRQKDCSYHDWIGFINYRLVRGEQNRALLLFGRRHQLS